MNENVDISRLNKFLPHEYIILTLTLLCSLVLIIFLLNNYNSYLGIVVFFFIVLSFFIIYSTRNFELFLIIISIFSLSYLNNIFFYSFKLLLIQNLTLTFFLFIAFFTYLYKTKNFKIKIPYLLKAIIIYVSYSFLLFFLGLLHRAPFELCFKELYQNFYFFFAIPIYFLFKKEEEYVVIFKWIILTFVIICIEYIIINFNSILRFTTFQNHFLPFIVAFLLSALLFIKKSPTKKILLSVLLFIVIWGSFATRTRILLVANIVSILIVVFYFVIEKVKGFKRLIYVFSLCFFVMISAISFKGGSSKKMKVTSINSKRFESITDPTSDISFLMRVEAVYWGVKKIKQSPILGEGFGFPLRLKWLLKTSFLFPDNSYLYYLLKGGIIFFFIALWMYYRLIISAHQIYKFSEQPFARYTSVAIIGGMAGIFLTGLLDANLVRFKLNLIYAVFFAYIEFERKNLSRNNFKSLK